MKLGNLARTTSFLCIYCQGINYLWWRNDDPARKIATCAECGEMYVAVAPFPIVMTQHQESKPL